MHVLLIDDDTSLRRTTRIALEAMEHQVTEARNGAEALGHLGHRPFQIAMLDLRWAANRDWIYCRKSSPSPQRFAWWS